LGKGEGINLKKETLKLIDNLIHEVRSTKVTPIGNSYIYSAEDLINELLDIRYKVTKLRD